MTSVEHGEAAKTPKEIERKFLVAQLPKNFHHNPNSFIRQGYLEINEDGSEERIRDRDGVYTRTKKHGKGLVRGEEEHEITAEEFDALWPQTEGKRVEKNRFTIPHGPVTIELDIYDGELWGLGVAEVEFPDESSAAAYEVPEWFGAEVTEDKRYKNQQLALYGMPVTE